MSEDKVSKYIIATLTPELSALFQLFPGEEFAQDRWNDLFAVTLKALCEKDRRFKRFLLERPPAYWVDEMLQTWTESKWSRPSIWLKAIEQFMHDADNEVLLLTNQPHQSSLCDVDECKDGFRFRIQCLDNLRPPILVQSIRIAYLISEVNSTEKLKLLQVIRGFSNVAEINLQGIVPSENLKTGSIHLRLSKSQSEDIITEHSKTCLQLRLRYDLELLQQVLEQCVNLETMHLSHILIIPNFKNGDKPEELQCERTGSRFPCAGKMQKNGKSHWAVPFCKAGDEFIFTHPMKDRKYTVILMATPDYTHICRQLHVPA